jgi:hypothetical protein
LEVSNVYFIAGFQEALLPFFEKLAGVDDKIVAFDSLENQ